MATAAFDLMKCIGSGAGTEQNSNNNPCFLNKDLVSTDTASNRVAVPGSGDPANYSFEQWLRLKCTTAPNNQCDNFKFYGVNQQPDDPTNKVTILAGTTGTGVTPTSNASTVAVSAQHTNYYATDTGVHLAIGVVPSDNIIDAINEETDYLVLQMKIEEGAARGNIEDIPFYLEYDQS